MIVSSKLLVLQSKRLLLTNAAVTRRLAGRETSEAEMARLEGAVQHALERYNSAVLTWASALTPQYRLVAYNSLIAKAERLRSSLENPPGELPAADRREVLADLSALQRIIDGWRNIARASMGEAVA
jgi:hypothetical protein